MAKISNETKITLTIVIALVVAFFGYRLMRDLPLFQQSQVVYTHFEQVSGLTTGSYIYINGVKVGSIKKIELIARDSVEVSLGFNVGIEINRGSVAYLESTGLLGDKAINIQEGSSDRIVPSGGVIKGVYSGGMMETLQSTGSGLASDASESFNKLNGTLSQLRQVVDAKNRGKIDETLSNLERASSELSILMESKRRDLGSSIESARRFMANLDTVTNVNRARIDSALAGLDRSMQNLETVTADLEQTNNQINTMLTKLNNGKGSLGKLMNDPSLYNNMDSLSVNLNKLIKNINEDPGRYLKGLRLVDVF